jgi:putative SOS response-associated peptidase YedK
MLHTCTIITGEPNELREIHTRIPIIHRKTTMMLGYPVKPEKKFWSASTAGDLRKKNRTSSKKV